MPSALRILVSVALLCAVSGVAQAKGGPRCYFVGGYAAAQTRELLAQAQTEASPDEAAAAAAAADAADAAAGYGIVRNPGAGVTFGGYTYATVVLGNGQEWMAENLRTTTYANGDPIQQVTDGDEWSAISTGAWAHYVNNASYEDPYGKLYNWYAVADPRNVCPTNWHVPTDAEWTVLTDYLGGESVAGGKMKSTGTQYWASPNTGATNESGFSGLPGGSRHSLDGTFSYLGNGGSWWSASENENVADYAWNRTLLYSTAGIYQDDNDKWTGFSVRCLRD